MGDSKPSSAATSEATPRRRLSPAELAPRVLALLPGKQAHIAKALGRKPSDGTVRKALQGLEGSGAAERVGGEWRRCDELPAPAAPADFDQEAVALHSRTLTVLVEQGTWRNHDIDLLDRYTRREQDARGYRVVLEDDGRFQRSKTRIYAHPAIDKERDALRDVQSLADALVITPDARKRHGRDSKDDPEGDEFDQL